MLNIKMPSSYTMIFIIIIIAALATWIVPTGRYSRMGPDNQLLSPELSTNYSSPPVPGTYAEVSPNQQNVVDVLTSPILGLYNAKEVIVFIFIIGGFLGVILQTKAIDIGIIYFIQSFKNRQGYIIPFLMLLFSIGGTTYGMGEELIGFYPILIPIMIMSGYDKLVAAAIMLLGAGAGVIGSTVNPFATGIAADAANVSIGEGLVLRVIIWLTCLIISIYYVSKYANTVKKDKKKSLVYNQIEEDKKHFLQSHHQDDKILNQNLTSLQKATLLLFGLTFTLMVYSALPFSDWGITAIPTLNWGLSEFSVLFFTSAILSGVINRMSEQQFINYFIAGAKDMVGVALIIGIARGVSVIMTQGAIIDTILFWTESLVSNLSNILFINVVFVINGLLSFIVPSSSGLAAMIMPIIAPVANIAGVTKGLIITAYQSASGVINLITPTSAILMAGITISRIEYKTWLKFITPVLFAMIIAISVIISMSLLI